MRDDLFIAISILRTLIRLKNIKSCSDIAGIVYKFENNKVVSFQDNFN